MKKLCIIFLLLTYVSISYAQYISIPKKTDYTIVYRDTIHIRGIVYDTFGKPAFNVMLKSKNDQIQFSGYNLFTTTDPKGRFELSGALVHDTINISSWSIKSYNIINDGSRYIEITLPAPEKDNQVKPNVSFSAKRKYKKILPTFKVVNNAVINDYDGLIGQNVVILPRPTEYVYQLLEKSLIYPEKAIVNNIEGNVEIELTIDRDGTPRGFKVVRGIGYGCEDEVIRILSIGAKWKPGINSGLLIAMKTSITINFKLTDK